MSPGLSSGEEKWHHEAPRLFITKERCFFVAKIYLIRHGESIANTKGIYQGQTYDTVLSPLGVRQADAIADRLRYEQIKQVIASPLTRTQQTARAIKRFHSVSIDIHRQIIETNHGEWEGKRISDIKRLWPRMYHTWTHVPIKVKFPKGETFGDLQKRVWRWWMTATPHFTGPTVIVTHDNVIRIILAGILRIPAEGMWVFELQPAGVTIIDIIKRKTTVVVINDTGHLRGLEANLAKHAL